MTLSTDIMIVLSVTLPAKIMLYLVLLNYKSHGAQAPQGTKMCPVELRMIYEYLSLANLCLRLTPILLTLKIKLLVSHVKLNRVRVTL